MPANCAWMLGGFTQTSSRPSSLGCLVTEEARRGMNELCFNCGQRRFQGEHLRLRKCPYSLRGVEYECSKCNAKLLVTARGHAEPVLEPARPAQACDINASASSSGAKRVASPTVVAQPRQKAAKTASSSGGMSVNICGVEYTALSWYLSNANPGRPALDIARGLVEGVVELDGAHNRSLVGTAYAKMPPSRPKPLCRLANGQARERFIAEPMATEIPRLTVQRVRSRIKKRLSQVLFPVALLEQAFSTQ